MEFHGSLLYTWLNIGKLICSSQQAVASMKIPVSDERPNLGVEILENTIH